MRSQSELKTVGGWRYATGGGAWSTDAFPTRDAARAAKKSSGMQKGVDSAADPVVALDRQSTNNRPASEPAQKGSKTMTLTLKGLSKNGKRAIFTGAAAGFHVPVSAFVDRTPPASFEVADGIFAPAIVREPKPKLTAEERKALRASKPKPTLAEKIEQRRKALAALEAKLAEKQTEL